MTEINQTAAERRTEANRKIKKLSKRLGKLVKASLVYEAGEIVAIPAGDADVLMEVIEPTGEYGEYRVRLLEDNRVITQSARYFQAPRG